MFWIWSGSVAAILVGAFFSLNYLFNVPVTSPKSVTVFAADPNEQRIVLELNDGKQFFLDDEPKKKTNRWKNGELLIIPIWQRLPFR